MQSYVIIFSTEFLLSYLLDSTGVTGLKVVGVEGTAVLFKRAATTLSRPPRVEEGCYHVGVLQRYLLHTHLPMYTYINILYSVYKLWCVFMNISQVSWLEHHTYIYKFDCVKCLHTCIHTHAHTRIWWFFSHLPRVGADYIFIMNSLQSFIHNNNIFTMF